MPILTLITLIAIVLLVSYGAKLKRLAPLFRITPVPFWCYFLPMLLGTIGFLTRESPLYPFLSKHLLPVCLVFLLIGADLRSLAKMGKTAITAMLGGTLGVLIGAIVSFSLFRRWLPEDSWMGFGALSASWIGGSANMLAVKESIGVPDSVFTPLVIVDAFLSYTWMAVLMSGSGWQKKWDGKFRGDSDFGDSPHSKGTVPECISPPFFYPFIFLSSTALLVSIFAQWVGARLPPIGGIFTPYTWTILLVTTFSLLLSFTRFSQLSNEKTTKLGYFLLFLLITSIGAKVDINSISRAPLFLSAGVVWLLIHACTLLLLGKIFRIPLFFLATASQANIGGPASAPIVAAVYQPKLASIGLLMAILGNILGTYLGLLSAATCRWIAR